MPPADLNSACPASVGADVLVNDAHDSERPGTIVDREADEYLIRFSDGTERWLRLSCLRTRDGQAMSTPRRPTSSNIRRAATVNLATPAPRRYSQEVEVGNIKDLHPAAEITAPERRKTEPALHLDKAPPARHSARGPERPRSSGRYSYTGESEHTARSDQISARAVETARKTVASSVPPPPAPTTASRSTKTAPTRPSETATRTDDAGAPSTTSTTSTSRGAAAMKTPEPERDPAPEHPNDDLSGTVKKPPTAAWILVAVGCIAIAALVLLWAIDF